MDRKPRLIFGLGSGRCGTKSLARLLGLPHEATPLPWNEDRRRFDRALERARAAGGDVGMYWLRYVPALAARCPGVRFVCLRRDLAETVDSWLRRMKNQEAFYLPADRRTCRASMFPPDSTSFSKRRAAELFVRTYYHHAEALAAILQSFRIFDMLETFESERGQRDLFRFLGLERATELGIRENPSRPS